MAYQPKYAQKKPSRRERPVEARSVAQSRERKMSKKVLALFVALGIVIIPAASFLTGKLLLAMARDLGRPKAASVKAVADLDIGGSFAQRMEAQIYGTRTALSASEKPDIPEQEIQVEPVRKVYWIEEDVLVAPEPDQSKFGKSNDPAVLQQVLEGAKWLLDGQNTYFSPERERYSDSIVNYYLDDSIFAVAWQAVHDGSVYTFSEIILLSSAGIWPTVSTVLTASI